MDKAKVHTYILLALTVWLFGCQPDTPPQQAGQAAPMPAPAPAVVSPAPAQPTKQAAAAPATSVVPPAPVQPASKTQLDDGAIIQLAKDKKCFSCHALERKLVGPAWKDIAAKYRGQKDAEAILIDKVAKGGKGAWGVVPMPPNAPRVSQDDIRTLVNYILSLQ